MKKMINQISCRNLKGDAMLKQLGIGMKKTLFLQNLDLKFAQ